MIIEKILRQLTPERVKREIETIQRVKLPPEFRKWVEEYKKVGKRTELLWKWIYNADKTVTDLFNIPRKYYYSITEISFLLHMLTNLIDDVSEVTNGKNLLNELLKIPFDQKNIEIDKLNNKEKKYLKFTVKVWYEIDKKSKKFPYYRNVKEIFEYDLQQLLNTTKYSFLIYRNPYLVNKTEYWMYLPQNMQFTNVFDFCFMCSKPDFKNIGPLREILLHAQKMARIGNDMGTWEREIKKGDFANGICAYAIDLGILSVDELKKENKFKIIKEIKESKIEEKIFEEWERSYCKIKEIIKKNTLRNLNVKKFLPTLEKITLYHLGSRGYI